MSSSISCRFKKSQRAIIEMTMKHTGVIYGYFLFFTRTGMYSFFDKSFGHGGNILYSSIKPHGSVYTMGQQVSSNTRSGRIIIQAP